MNNIFISYKYIFFISSLSESKLFFSSYKKMIQKYSSSLFMMKEKKALFLITGMGKDFDISILNTLLLPEDITYINIGFAGSLSTTNKLFQIISPSHYIDNQGLSTSIPDYSIFNKYRENNKLYTSEKPILSTEEKDKLISLFSIDLVDMEYGKIIKNVNNVKCIKIISDYANNHALDDFKNNLPILRNKFKEIIEDIIF